MVAADTAAQNEEVQWPKRYYHVNAALIRLSSTRRRSNCRGGRALVWTIVNLEVWDIGEPMARQVLAAHGRPNARRAELELGTNTACRVGVLALRYLRRLKIRPTLAINARVCKISASPSKRKPKLGVYGPFLKQGRSTPTRSTGRGRRTRSTYKNLLRETARFWSLRPASPRTLETPEILAAAGIRMCFGDSVYDDQPAAIRTAVGPLLTLLPFYTVDSTTFR